MNKKLFKYFIILSSIVINQQLLAQINFVPNYSFEDKDSCPSNVAEIGATCKNWFTSMTFMPLHPPIPYCLNGWGNSDYFNVCGGNNVQIPKNYVGFQYPHFGDAYAGFLLIYNTEFDSYNFKENIEVELQSDLIENNIYCVSLYYSFGEVETNIFPYKSTKLELLFSDTIIYQKNGIGTFQPQNIIANAQISEILPIKKDTQNWIEMKGSFVAKGGERYLTIGNFQADSMNDRNVYLYIDDVKIWECGIYEPKNIIIPNVFTPNDDGFNDVFKYQNQEDWTFTTQIFNRWGEMIYNNSSSENWDGTYKGTKVPEGVYFYFVQAVAKNTKEIKQYKGTVSVFYN